MNLKTIAIASALAVGLSGAAFAQNSSSDSKGSNSTQMNNENPATTGQGTKSGPGASEVAPGRNPGTATETNPGHGGTSPDQLIKKNNDAGSGTRL